MLPSVWDWSSYEVWIAVRHLKHWVVLLVFENSWPIRVLELSIDWLDIWILIGLRGVCTKAIVFGNENTKSNRTDPLYFHHVRFSGSKPRRIPKAPKSTPVVLYTDAYFVLNGTIKKPGTMDTPGHWNKTKCCHYENGWGYVIYHQGRTFFASGAVSTPPDQEILLKEGIYLLPWDPGPTLGPAVSDRDESDYDHLLS